MRYRLPSLNALRAFEAAARRGSLSAAALELGVSVGAVSRHIGLLEAHFGLALFERHRAGVRLTTAGATYFESVRAAFESIDQASRALAQPARHGLLKLRFYTSFATEWLAPRLPAFRAAHPQISFNLTLATAETEWDGDFDLAMTAAPPDDDRFHRDLLFDSRFALVCSPALLSGCSRPADLASQILLIAPRERPIWPVVLDALGAASFEHQDVLEFESLSLTYQAARGGAGIALGNLFMLAADLQEGRLNLPFRPVMRMSLPHYLLTRRDRLADPGLTAFRRWLMAEASSCEAMLSSILAAHSIIDLPPPAPLAFSFLEGCIA